MGRPVTCDAFLCFHVRRVVGAIGRLDILVLLEGKVPRAPCTMLEPAGRLTNGGALLPAH
eukprot:scaffold216995_cov28-Tisochrysis_lutea.AAC.2